ncbi:MAG TPA: HAMP domain-containing sensor histidine kinase [Acidisphaera sp.]|nr:HAMP domain-containing sensor histidine kinase [Acidisphaera sp.]
MRDAAPSLTRLLAMRLAVTSAIVCAALLVIFFAKYKLDTPALRRATLESDLHEVTDALARGEDPGAWRVWSRYPDAYGLRILMAPRANPTVLVERNPALLPPLAPPGSAGAATGVSEGFSEAGTARGEPGGDRWLLTDHVDIGKRSLWIQLAMVGDPDRHWLDVIGDEMTDHVLVPMAFIVPALAISLLLTTTRALRPLQRIADSAEALGRSVRAGAPLVPLPTERLPREFASVVAALNAMLESLERSLQQQKAFTSNVAHELRTPLAAVLLEASALPPDAAVERMKADLDSLGSLVNELLRFAQAEDAMAQSREEVDLADASRTICEELAPAAVTRSLTLAFSAPASPVCVHGNRALIDIAIRNVVDNAMKASAPGQEVEVAVDRDCDVVVEDRGPGVPDTHKARIFERFFRADRTRAGTGVGLPLVRRIAQLHGGDVRVEDRPGGGARFVLSFAPHA